MKYTRFILACVVIFFFALVWNGLVHLVILSDANSILTLIGRPEAERSMPLSLISTLAVSVLFVWSYSRLSNRGSMATGITHGLFFSLLAGVLVDLNQFVIYPIPASLALSWFAFGVIEFTMYGILVSWVFRVGSQAT